MGIDVAGALQPETGIGRYTLGLAGSLAELAPDLEVVLFCNAFRIRDVGRVLNLPGRVVNPRLPARVLLAAWERLHWPPVDLFTGRVDVFHTSDWVHPPQRRGATVTTIHDLGALVHAEWYASDVVKIHQRKNQAAADLATAIIAPSEFTRGEFLRLYDVEPKRVHVVYEGVSSVFCPQDPERAAATLRRFALTEPFLLYVGTRERRKNVLGLIDIFARVRERRPEVMLAVVGMRPCVEAKGVHGVRRWSGTEVEDRIRQLGVAGQVRVLGHVSLQELVDLYSSAEALLYPTYYEGFGLPALEAMACGLPVVASSRSALPEVIGDAGLLVDPDDPGAFAEAVLRVLSDGGLHERCRSRGLERASRFTWEATARGTLAVYTEAVERV
ncbi:MAG: glycosyltransferase family 1 protein [Candidatus Rokuibacteriota bacterium]